LAFSSSTDNDLCFAFTVKRADFTTFSFPYLCAATEPAGERMLFRTSLSLSLQYRHLMATLNCVTGSCNVNKIKLLASYSRTANIVTHNLHFHHTFFTKLCNFCKIMLIIKPGCCASILHQIYISTTHFFTKLCNVQNYANYHTRRLRKHDAPTASKTRQSLIN
jgi:hypothetical protein